SRKRHRKPLSLKELQRKPLRLACCAWCSWSYFGTNLSTVQTRNNYVAITDNLLGARAQAGEVAAGDGGLPFAGAPSPPLDGRLRKSPADHRALPGGGRLAFPALLGDALALDLGPDVVAVHAGDEVEADLLRADGLALAVAGAGAEALGVHLRDHRADAAP